MVYILVKTDVQINSLHEILWLKDNLGDYPDKILLNLNRFLKVG